MDRTKRFGITVLGSGSSGNASLIHGPDGAILIDAGFSSKDLHARIRAAGEAPENVKAILVTHEHGDHIKGCRVFADHYKIPTYLTRAACQYLENANLLGERRTLFSPGSAFKVQGLDVEAFSVQHDALDPVGFIISSGGGRIGIATDLGHVNMLGLQRLRGCDALVLESNHDMGMLRASGRPIHLKRRIMGRHGHLNNDDAMEALESLLTPETRFLILAHLSMECNSGELVARLALERLAKLRRTDILLLIAEQAKPIQTVWLR